MVLVFGRNIEAAELMLNIIFQSNDIKMMEGVAQRKYEVLVIWLPHGNTLVIKSQRTRKIALYFSEFGE